MIEELSGRKNFNSNLYLQNDELGKKLAIKILANSLLVKSGDYGILKPKEDNFLIVSRKNPSPNKTGISLL